MVHASLPRQRQRRLPQRRRGQRARGCMGAVLPQGVREMSVHRAPYPSREERVGEEASSLRKCSSWTTRPSMLSGR